MLSDVNAGLSFYQPFRKSCLSIDFDVCNTCLNANIPVGFAIFEDNTYIVSCFYFSHEYLWNIEICIMVLGNIVKERY